MTFEEWSASVKDCGFEVQPFSATAKQRRLGWEAGQESMRPLVEKMRYALSAMICAAKERNCGLMIAEESLEEADKFLGEK